MNRSHPAISGCECDVNRPDSIAQPYAYGRAISGHIERVALSFRFGQAISVPQVLLQMETIVCDCTLRTEVAWLRSDRADLRKQFPWFVSLASSSAKDGLVALRETRMG